MGKPALREVARMVVLDEHDNVLLVRYRDAKPMDPDGEGPLKYWVPPGGALKSGESYTAAAERELEEETGLAAKIGPMIWQVEQQLRYRDEIVNQKERYFLARVDTVRPPVSNRTSEAILEHRWWALPDLHSSREQFFPRGFIELIGPVVQGRIPSRPTRI